MAGSSITPNHSDGFTLSSIHLDLAARLSGRDLILHPGTANTIGAANHMRSVNYAGNWRCKVVFVAAGGSFAFSLHNHNGYSNGYIQSPGDLGTLASSYIAFVFRVDSGVTSFGPRIGRQTGIGHTAPTATPDGGNPGSNPDFTNGHNWLADMEWTAATTESSNDGIVDLTLVDLNTSQSWGFSYGGFDAIPPMYRLAEGKPSGDRGFCGFSAQTFGSTRPAVTLKSWEWTDADGAPNAIHRTTSLTIGSPGRFSGGVYVSDVLKLPLFDAVPLNAGTYLIRTDGMDEMGVALPSTYDIKVIECTATADSNLIGQNPFCIPYIPMDLYGGLHNQGMAVSPNGVHAIALTWSQDSVGQEGRFLMDATNGHTDLSRQPRFKETSACGHGWAFVGNMVGHYLFTDDSHYPDCRYYVDRHNFNYATPNDGFTGATYPESVPAAPEDRLVHTNPDGSTIEWYQGYNVTLVLIFHFGVNLLYHLVPRIAANISAGRFIVAVKFKHYVGEYDSTNAHQIGTTIDVPNPCAVCYLPDGTIAVAHSVVELDEDDEQVYHDYYRTTTCPATIISMFDASTHALIGTMPISGFVDITDLSCINGRLAIFDNGEGRRCVKVHSITGHTLGTLQRTFFRQATYLDDDGRETLWKIGGGCIDADGNVYVNGNLFGTSEKNSGTLAQRFLADGTFDWNRYAAGYTNCATGGPSLEPGLVFTNMLTCLEEQPDGTHEFIGNISWPGAEDGEDPLFGAGDGGAPTPLSVANLGGADFLAIPVNYRLPIYRLLGRNKVRPVATIGYRYVGGVHGVFTWTREDSGWDMPEVGDDTWTADAAPHTGPGAGWQLGNDSVWLMAGVAGREIFRFPMTFNAAGNPVFNPSAHVLFASPSAATYLVQDALYMATASDAVYVISSDSRYAPITSASFGGTDSMGGCRTLNAFDRSGNLLWRRGIPEFCSSISAWTGYVTVVGYLTSNTYVFRRSDGLLSAVVPPVTESDVMDITGGSTSATLRPDGTAIILLESIRASGYLKTIYDDSASYPIYSATLPSSTPVALADISGESTRVAVSLRRSGGFVKTYFRRYS